MSFHKKYRLDLCAHCIVALKVVFCLGLLLLTGAAFAMTLENNHDGDRLIIADVNDPNQPPMPSMPFALIVFLDKIDDAIVGQRCVLPITVIDEGIGKGASDPVKLSVSPMEPLSDATMSIEPSQIRPGEVAELTIIPMALSHLDPNNSLPWDDDWPVIPVDPDDMEQERKVFVDLMAERGGVRRSRMIEVNVILGEDLLGETAAFYRDLFVPWLAEHHPELGITAQTEWVGTIVRPRILVVMYYLFFSPEWEMGVRWHVMIPPYDWAEIYLRHRSELSSTWAWRIHSVAGQLEPEVTELPSEGIFR